MYQGEKKESNRIERKGKVEMLMIYTKRKLGHRGVQRVKGVLGDRDKEKVGGKVLRWR